MVLPEKKPIDLLERTETTGRTDQGNFSLQENWRNETKKLSDEAGKK